MICETILNSYRQGRFPFFYAGGANRKNEQILNENDCLRLQSYAMERTNIMRRIANGHKTFIDSGAYSAMTKGIDINIDDYIDFINTYEDSIILACQFDVIPDAKTDPETSARKTWENFLYMRERVNNPSKLLYVWHSAEDVKWLQQALDLEPRIEYMALGGLVGKSVKQRDEAMKKCFDTIKASKNPNICVHAFGMSNRKLLKKYPFTSADSTSWLQPVRFGNIHALDFKSILISERQFDNPKHYYNLPQELRQAVDIEVQNLGYEVQFLIDNPGERTCYQTVYWNDYFSKFVQEEDNPVVKMIKKEIGQAIEQHEVNVNDVKEDSQQTVEPNDLNEESSREANVMVEQEVEEFDLW